MENRCLCLTKDHNLYIEDRPIPQPESGYVVVQVKAVGICGSDVHFFRDGKMGVHIIEEPIVPGHESSGIIHAVGEGIKGLEAGQKVIIEPGIPCRMCSACTSGRYNICENLAFMSTPGTEGTFQKFVSVRADLIHPMPEDMSFKMGALVEPAAVALHAVRRAGNKMGKTIAIMGTGPIGLLALMAFKVSGAGKVICIDINSERLKKALELGADEVINPSKEKLPESFADIAIETAGNPVTTAQLILVAKIGGTIVQVGWPKGNMVNMNIGMFNAKELEYRGSMDYANDFPMSIYYLSSGRMDAGKIVTHEYDFEHVIDAFEFTAEHPELVIKTMVNL